MIKFLLRVNVILALLPVTVSSGNYWRRQKVNVISEQIILMLFVKSQIYIYFKKKIFLTSWQYQKSRVAIVLIQKLFYSEEANDTVVDVKIMK